MADRPVVRTKKPDADFGVYFQIVNTIGVDLGLETFESHSGGCTTYPASEPQTVPTDGKPYQLHLFDPCSSQGADGTLNFVCTVDGQRRLYAWSGACPVWSPSNSASGPGIQSFNRGGHPLTVSIAVNKDTPGWQPH